MPVQESHATSTELNFGLVDSAGFDEQVEVAVVFEPYREKQRKGARGCLTETRKGCWQLETDLTVPKNEI